ncbi:MAG: hypothetical protein AB1390_10355 [Nitrospirota bacterium]
MTVSRFFGLGLTEIMRHMRVVQVFFIAVVLILGAATTKAWAQGELEAKLIIETNFTDRDSGIQVFTDGDPWKRIEIKNPHGKKILDVMAKGNLKKFGLTELFLESNEPNYDEMSLIEILSLFPEGEYEFKGLSVEGEKLEGTAELSHEIPCAPDNLSPFDGEIVSSAGDVIISWNSVVNMLDNDAETCTGGSITVETYQVIVENLETDKVFSIVLGAKPGGNQVTLPDEFITSNSIYKYEVLAIAENGNQTIAETFFCTDLAAVNCVLPE